MGSFVSRRALYNVNRFNCRRYGQKDLCQGADKLRQYVSKPVSNKPNPVWTRLAEKITDVDLETSFSKERHLEQLRAVFDPHASLGKLEDELQEEIASSLGKTGGKCVAYFGMLKKLAAKHAACSCVQTRNQVASAFNEFRVLARESRRDLIIHRQAAGFTFQNHRIVEEEFPLPPKMQIEAS